MFPKKLKNNNIFFKAVHNISIQVNKNACKAEKTPSAGGRMENAMKKNIKFIILAGIMVLALSGCGTDKNKNNATQTPAPPSSTASSMNDKNSLEQGAEDTTNDIKNGVNDAAEGAGNAVKDAAEGAGNAAKDLAEGAGDAVENAGKAVGDAAQGVTGNK